MQNRNKIGGERLMTKKEWTKKNNLRYLELKQKYPDVWNWLEYKDRLDYKEYLGLRKKFASIESRKFKKRKEIS